MNEPKTKPQKTRLVKQEKEEIAKLYKCARSSNREAIYTKLESKRVAFIVPFVNDLADLRAKYESKRDAIVKQKNDTLEQAGLHNLDRNGCLSTCAELDEYDRITNTQLRKLWSGEVNNI